MKHLISQTQVTVIFGDLSGFLRVHLVTLQYALLSMRGPEQ